MMIEDDKREGMDSGRESFQVLADSKAEQDYAANIYKGSGIMEPLIQSMEKDAK